MQTRRMRKAEKASTFCCEAPVLTTEPLCFPQKICEDSDTIIIKITLKETLHRTSIHTVLILINAGNMAAERLHPREDLLEAVLLLPPLLCSDVL